KERKKQERQLKTSDKRRAKKPRKLPKQSERKRKKRPRPWAERPRKPPKPSAGKRGKVRLRLTENPKKHRGRPRQKPASNNRQIRRLIRQAPPIVRIELAYSTRALGHVRFRSHQLGGVEPFRFSQGRLRATL